MLNNHPNNEKFSKVKRCACCGVAFKTKHGGRKAIFCSAACRSSAARRHHFRNARWPTSARHETPTKNPAISADYKGQNGGRALPFDLIGHASHRWPNPPIDRALLRKILAIEIGEGVHHPDLDHAPDPVQHELAEAAP
jgi:hypothetical protein